MARKTSAPLLDEGDPFPRLELTLTDGKRLTLPGDLSRPYNVVLVNRGAWCPFCVAQLKSFQIGLGKLAEVGIGVVSVSADTRQRALAVVGEHQLEFPVAWETSVDAIVDALGVYYEPAGRYFHSAGFLVGPGGRVLLAVYSSGAIGRLVWQDVLGLVKYLQSHGRK